MSAVEQSQLFSRLSLWKDHGKAWAVLGCDSFGIKHNHIKHNTATTPPGMVTNVHLGIPAEHSLRNFKPKKKPASEGNHTCLWHCFLSPGDIWCHWSLVSLIFSSPRYFINSDVHPGGIFGIVLCRAGSWTPWSMGVSSNWEYSLILWTSHSDLWWK